MRSAAASIAPRSRAHIATRVPSRANSCATAKPSPWLAAATSATLPRSPRSVFVYLFGVRHARRDHDDLTRAHVVCLSRRAEDQAQRPGEHLRDLLRLVDVFCYFRAFREPDLRDHRVLAVDVAALDRAAEERLGREVL